MKIAGIDEAGRGCVLGPMVLAMCVLDREKTDFFKTQGVKDSKQLTKRERERLFPLIKENCLEYKIIAVPAEELNVLMDSYSLNQIEALKSADLIKEITTEPNKIVLDAVDRITDNYVLRIKNILKEEKYKDLNIVAEKKADDKYVSVACASVLAKVTRDRILERLVGSDISGYSSDPKTIDFLKKYFIEHKEFPDYTRLKWKTVDNIVKSVYQKKLDNFK